MNHQIYKAKSTKEKTEAIFTEQQQKVYKETDRMFALLMSIQWLASIFAAFVISPQTWIGQTNHIHIHIWAALILGSIINIVPILLAVFQPGKVYTRYTIAIGQLLMSSLLIHITGGRIETHFHVFGSLAFLSFYKDFRVLIPATIVIALDHFIRGVFYPQSVFGVLTAGSWRWVEHAAWIVFIDIFLVISCIRDRKALYVTARRTAKLDASEEQYRSVIENAEDIIFRTDPVGRFTLVNQQFLDVFGLKKITDLNLFYSDVVAKDHLKKVRRFYRKQFTKQTHSTYLEFPVVKSDGSKIWIGQKVKIISNGEKIEGFQALARDISARVQAEQALKDSEARYRTVTDSASDAIVTIDTENTILFANQATEKIFGYKVDELIGKELFTLIPPSHREMHKAGMRRYLTTAQKNISWHSAEVPALHKNGNEFSIEISFGEYVSNGKQIFTAILRDITERKRAQEAIRKSEEYQNLFKHANDSIVIFDPVSEKVVSVNDHACKTYGFEREEFIGLNLKNITKDVKKGEKHLKNLLKNKTVDTFETVQFAKNGKPLHLLINSSIIEFEGKPAVLTINRDISLIVAANSALHESEYKFRTLIENMSEGVVQTNERHEIIFTNERFCQMSGYSREELMNRKPSEFLISEEDRKQINKAIKQHDKGFSEAYEIKLKTKSGKYIWVLTGAVPLLDDDNKKIGLMTVHTDITERKQAEEKLLHNAMHDSLTNLPNRALLNEHLRQSIKREKRNPKTSFAVLFLDFDRFKVINDSLGHLEGDKLLINIARRLEKTLRPGDMVARLGGDEFTILVENVENVEEVLTVVERVQETVKKPFYLNEQEIHISTSIGIALSNQRYKTPEEILRDADIAMYQAKNNGKARFELFNEKMQEQADKQLQLETEIRLALDRKEFCVYYQPIVELNTEKIKGFEALVRWIHPTRGIISPMDFIPVAEETNLIVPIGEEVLYQSCRQMREWQLTKPEYKNLTISVNLSSKQFLEKNLVERVSEILEETGLNPRHLKLEVTETHLMENDKRAIEIMEQLRKIGVKFSIDDFGTGYSSLNYLHHLPVKYLKVDRSFVSRMHENEKNIEIVRTIILLAKAVGIEVVAEGVETEEQADLLRTLRCTFGQGYLFSKPLSKDDVIEFLETKSVYPTLKNNFSLELEIRS